METSPGALVSLVVAALFVALNAIFLYYVYGLAKHGCKCALGWRRSFIEVSLVLFVALGAAGLLGFSTDGNVGLSVLVMALSVAYVLVTRQFVDHVREHECECAQSPVFNVLNVVNLVQIVVLAVVALLVVVVTFMIIFAQRPAAPGAAAKARARVGRRQ